MKWILVDRIEQCEPGKSIVATKTLHAHEDFFADHFPGYPVVPGVLLIEMIAHSGSRCLLLESRKQLAILGSVRSAKFYRPVQPDDRCVISVEITSSKESYATAKGTIEVNNAKVAMAEILFGMIPFNLIHGTHEDEVMKEWRERQSAGVAL
jgi:3-hydroxyacyl-[acyl-carrier-protein] dehydratase